MLEIDLEKENLEIIKKYKELIKTTYRILSEEDKILIRKSFDLALDAHKDQRRKSGEPYIYHPIEVATIVGNEIGLDAKTIAAALMHDVVEDSAYTTEDIEGIFGSKMAKIIDGLTKFTIIDKSSDISIQAENYRKLFLTMSEDVRVVLIKLADRLHNMRTLDFMNPQKQKKIASESAYIYAPLAHRLGLYKIKEELEDLSLKYLEPEIYNEISRKIEETKEERESYLTDFKDKIYQKLNVENFKHNILSRSKSIYSIWRKMKKQGIPFEEVFDRFAIRILYDVPQEEEKFIAWKTYSIITDLFTTNPQRLRDWISQPKSTGYEALHTTVIGPKGKWVEIQVRSERMNEIAEKGIAAHYKYKQSKVTEDSIYEQWLNKIRDTIETNSALNTSDFIDDFKLNLYSKEIYVFTPKGELKTLPKGATSLDFAYEIHTRVGERCLGSKINGRIVPISTVLQSGDQIEIITTASQKPKADWLNFVVTSKARTKIKHYVNQETRNTSDEGKEILIRKLRHLKVDFNENTVNELVAFFKEKTSQDLFFKIKTGEITNTKLKDFVNRNSNAYSRILNSIKRTAISTVKRTGFSKLNNVRNNQQLIFQNNHDKLPYTLAPCCSPIYGDKVFGFVTVNKGIVVHKEDCSNAVKLRANFAYRILPASWKEETTSNFSVEIQLEGINKTGILNEITSLLTDKLKITINGLNASNDGGLFLGKLIVEIQNDKQLNHLISKLKGLEGVQRVYRK
ncbi:MAG: bifunctional (p)ppGpp synthetase/guanosine-3',5'-bis(diphosphate) 3'-pyrophosphohydrolase [Solirubrobacteraceae bacterium]